MPDSYYQKGVNGRSREGAWIEIKGAAEQLELMYSRSREGAWIEMTAGIILALRQDCRSREGAWIEIMKY